LSVHSNSTLSVPGVESQLSEWEKDAWVPDVICIDYADIMAPVDRRLEGLDRINETWKALRGLSQKHNCLVVTATQARRNGPAKWLMDREDIADDKRKLGHVTAMFGINRTAAEISAGIWRLNPIGARDLALHAGDCVYTGGSLDIGNPALVSTF
jgi:replicative DNA helicase